MSLGDALYEQVVAHSQLCDVTITTGDSDVKAHWCVLVTCPYFQALYSSNLIERQSGYIRLGVPEKGLQNALRYLYTGECDVTSDDIQPTLVTADYLQMSSLMTRCQRFLQNVRLTPENCMWIRDMAEIYNLNGLCDKTLSFIRRHAEEILVSENVVDLNVESILWLLSMCDIGVSNGLLFCCVTRWIEYDPDERVSWFPDLFDCLELDRFSPDTFYGTISKHDYVHLFPTCWEKVSELNSKIDQGLVKLEPEYKPLLISVSKLIDSETVRNNSLAGLILYDVHRENWLTLSHLPNRFTSTNFLITIHGNFIYLIDGNSLQHSDNAVKLASYNVIDDSWEVLAILIPYYTKSKSFTPRFIQIHGSELYIGASYSHRGTEETFMLFSYSFDNDYQAMLRVCHLYSGQQNIGLHVLNVEIFCEKMYIITKGCEIGSDFIPLIFVCELQPYHENILTTIRGDFAIPRSMLVYVKSDSVVFTSCGTSDTRAFCFRTNTWTHDRTRLFPSLEHVDDDTLAISPTLSVSSRYTCNFVTDFLFIFEKVHPVAPVGLCQLTGLKIKAGEKEWSRVWCPMSNLWSDMDTLVLSSGHVRRITADRSLTVFGGNTA